MALTRASGKVVKTSVDTIADLPLTGYEGQTIEVLGYTTVGDGGGGTFRYTVTTSPVANGGTIFNPALDYSSPNYASTAGTGAWYRQYSGAVNVKWFGAKGDNTDATTTTAALQACFDLEQEWVIPEGTYAINNVLTIKSSGNCYGGIIKPEASYASLAVAIDSSAYFPKLHIFGLVVEATTTRVTGSVGIRVTAPGATLEKCGARIFNYGIQVWTYSVTLENCNALQCNTNLSASAPSSTSEINDLKVIGGTYDSAVDYSCRIGDTRFTTTVPDGELMGTNALFLGVAFDAATALFDRIYGLTIQSCYFEGPSGGNAIELGSPEIGASNSNWMRTVYIAGCYFSTVDYAIYCHYGINGLTVGPNYYGGNIYSALYAAVCETYPIKYVSGVSTSGFLGSEVHTGFSIGVSVGSMTFSGMSIDYDYLVNGMQIAPNESSVDNWYPNGKALAEDTTNISSSTGRFKTTPATSIAGTMSGQAFTCTTPADALLFNGGDRITATISGATAVVSVDYPNGIVYLNDSASGSGTISHDTLSFSQSNESGAFVTTLTPLTSGTITLTSTLDSIYYVKQGSLVTITGQITVDSVSSPLGTYVKLALPFDTAELPEISGRGGCAYLHNNVVTPLIYEEASSYAILYKDAWTVFANDTIHLNFSYVTSE